MSFASLVILSALTHPASTVASSAEPPPALAFAPIEDKPPVLNKWTGSLAAGVNVTDGNTDRRSANATFDAEYRREKDRTTLGALWNYADEVRFFDSPPAPVANHHRVVTERRVYGSAKYDRFLSKQTYVLAQTSGEYNANADVDLRSTLGVGVGRQFKEDEDLKVLGEAGLTYFNEDFQGGADDQEYVAARLAYKVDWKPGSKWTVTHGAEVFPSLEEADDVYAKVDTRVRVSLTEKMFAQLQWLYTWDNTPAGDNERVDNLYALALGWSF